MGAVGYEFEARLALGEIEVRHDSQKSGRARLQQLQIDARKAETALRGLSPEAIP